MLNLTLDDLISRLEQVQVYDKYISAVCVFHPDTKPSMLVFRDGWFRCLGCGRNGNWKTLWNKLQGQPVSVRVEKRTSFQGPPTGDSLEDMCYMAHEDLLKFESFQWYLEMRGLTGRIEVNEIGYMNGWYSFPVRDREGAFQTAVFRAAPHVQEVTGMRYWCRSIPLPYVPDWHLLDRYKYIFVVYGIMDALTLSELRLPVMTSTAGNNTFSPEWLNDYRKPVYIIPDSEEETQAQMLANNLGWRGNIVKLVYPAGKKDPNGFLEVGRRDDLVAQLQTATAKEK